MKSSDEEAAATDAAPTDVAPAGTGLERALTGANFISFFAIAIVEFAVPFVAVATLGANSLFVAALGICRFAPQVLFARLSSGIVNRWDQRTVLLASELLRVVVFGTAALALLASSTIGYMVFALANFCLGCASVLTAVSIQVMVPLAFPDAELPRVYSRLGVSESLADGVAPFLAGVGLAWIGISATFGVAALLAAGACLLLTLVPRVRATDEVQELPGPLDLDRSSMRHGLRVNFSSPTLGILLGWALLYNFGQCVIQSMLIIAILDTTPLRSQSLGLIMSCTVLFAALGAMLADHLPEGLRTGRGISVFGFGAIGSYALLGTGVWLGGTVGIVLIVAGLVVDEFSSGVVLVLVQIYRARWIQNVDRAAATATYRAMNQTAVPVGFLVGGVIGTILSPPPTIFVVGLAMLVAGTVVWAMPVRHASLEPAPANTAW